MAAAILQSSKVSVSGPFQISSHQPGLKSKSAIAPSSRSSQAGDVSDASSTSMGIPSSQPSTRAFGRLRSSLEQSLRTATRSKKSQSPPVDDFATVTSRQTKGNQKDSVLAVPQKEKVGMLRRLESKVTFRRAGRETPSPLPPVPVEKDPVDKMRLAGFTSFVTPSMRQGSMSSPSLHLSSQALPSPKSRPSIPVSSSSSNADIHATPTQARKRRESSQPSSRRVGSPTHLTPPREISGQAAAGVNQTPVSRHRSTKPGPSASPTHRKGSRSDDSGSQSPETPTPTRQAHDIPSPPTTPTPMSSSSQQMGRTARRGIASSSHLPLSTPPASPISPRTSSPIRPRPARIITPRGLASTSATHLPISPSSPPLSPRRPSVDQPRRISGDATRRPSVDSPRRARSPHDSSDIPEGDSPTARPRPNSPGQRPYMQNRHINMSTLSLSGPPNPEHRELIRTASSLLCKETIKIPPHMSKTESGVKDWDGVEVRIRALVRAERIWGKSGGAMGGSSSNLASPGGSGMSASAEERERRLFADALRDGYVLCQFMNKLRSASIVKPDARDDGVFRTSNVTKFLAACSSYGLPEEDLFQNDDLIEATGESLARVARTVIALVKFVDAPVVDKSRIIQGQGKSSSPISIRGPYQQAGGSSHASASTPNLFHPTAASPPTSPVKKRYSPPSAAPSDGRDRTIRAVSPTEIKVSPNKRATQEKQSDRVPALSPPPKSPLRAKTKRNSDNELATWAKAASSPQTLPTEPTRAAVGADPSYDPRQSIVSSAMTETTATTEISSILDFRRSNSGNNKYGTIRTVTTDLTSEAPSMTRTEANAIAEELSHKTNMESGTKHHRDRKLSEVPLVDLSRVVEEGDENASMSSQGNGRLNTAEQPKTMAKPDKPPALHLRKGKWPDDFMDAFQAHSSINAVTPKLATPDQDGSPVRTPISVSPPRKLAIVGASRRNESAEALSQFPRHPLGHHRARQSVDAPIIAPKEALSSLDNGTDGMVSGPSGNKGMLRRHSTKTNLPAPLTNAVHFASRNGGTHESNDDSSVPFPKASPLDHSGSPSPINPTDAEKPRILRGRFRSDINDSSSRRRVRPNSHDELGVKPLRSRIESMVNLGAASANASASDLLSRDSMDGSAVRKTLIIREEGKPATHFQLGNCIGRGQFGSVYRALNLNTGQMVAVKRIRLEGLKESEITTLMREVDLVKSLSHPSIVKYEGMARDANTLSIVLEYAENGSLGQTLKAFGKLNEHLVASYVVKILEGLHYLHQSDVVHCDLKAANILTTKNGNVKLSDFGVSLNLRAMEREIKDVAGTPNWMAPEVIELKGASTKSDIWSLACTVIELLTGKPPYADIANSMTVMYSIVEDDMPPLPPSCSPLLRDFLTICFNKDPRRRPSAMMLFEHPWLKQNWGMHKELRPQDSIPFLRRVSADLQKSAVARYLSQLDSPESPMAESSVQGDARPLGHRISDVSIRSPGPLSDLGHHISDVSTAPSGPLSDSNISPREHQFVKTTFSKPMVCRVCLLNVKKSAVLCAQCSLIAHSKCAINAPPTCDLRSKLLLYAKYAEQGHSTSAYSNPADGLRDIAKSPASDVPYVAHSSRTSIDAPSPPPHTPLPSNLVNPPTAYKFLGFKRSRQSLSPEPIAPTASSSVPTEEKLLRKKQRSGKQDRPQSLSSNSTGRSLGSAPTSYKGTRSSAHSTSVKPSPLNTHLDPVSDHNEVHDTGTIPGALPIPETTRRHKQREKSSGCSVQ